MKNTHVAADVFSYEFDAIEEWLSMGHDTSLKIYESTRLSTSHTQPYFFVLLFKTGITNEQHTLPPS